MSLATARRLGLSRPHHPPVLPRAFLQPNGAGKSTLMRAIANGQLDGFPPKSELRTVYVEHDIDASGGWVGGRLCLPAPVGVRCRMRGNTPQGAPPVRSGTLTPASCPPRPLQRPRPPWWSLW